MENPTTPKTLGCPRRGWGEPSLPAIGRKNPESLEECKRMKQINKREAKSLQKGRNGVF